MYSSGNPYYLAKDFIETYKGLIFAVVASGTEEGRVLCFLRYLQQNGKWQKQNTTAANAYLAEHHPEYLYYSPLLDARLHAVEVSSIIRHYQPRHRLQEVLANPTDMVEQDLAHLCGLWQEQGLDLSQVGVTGSVLPGVQHESSDLDLVCYSRTVFQQCRNLTAELIEAGRIQDLSEAAWEDAYQRRDCALSYAEYRWHEQRKYNKAMINQRKFDLGFIDPSAVPETVRYRKQGPITLECLVLDATYSFDYPARFIIDHPDIQSIVCFTATYAGQAVAGEWIEVAGSLEISEHGEQRIVVGSSREAPGEYIKVFHA